MASKNRYRLLKDSPLAVGDDLWEVRRLSLPASPSDFLRVRNIKAFVKCVDGAELRPTLYQFIQATEGRAAVRTAIGELLGGDDAPESQALLDLLRKP